MNVPPTSEGGKVWVVLNGYQEEEGHQVSAVFSSPKGAEAWIKSNVPERDRWAFDCQEAELDP